MGRENEEMVLTTLSADQLNSYTLNPAAHFYEVKEPEFKDGKLIRESFGNRFIDWVLYLTGAFYKNKETKKVIGGKSGFLDFIIPHYFVYRALLKWTENKPRAIAGFLITVPLALLSLFLYVAKQIVGVVVAILSLPFLGIAHNKYNKQYKQMRDNVLQNLKITKEDPTAEKMVEKQVVEEVKVETGKQENQGEAAKQKPKGLRKIFSKRKKKLSEETRETMDSPSTPPKTEKRTVTRQFAAPVETFNMGEAFMHESTYQMLYDGFNPKPFKESHPHFIQRVESYKPLFSEVLPSQHRAVLVEGRDNNTYIKVYTPELRVDEETQQQVITEKEGHTFFIKVDSENAEPLKQALHLNMFGITSNLSVIPENGDHAPLADVQTKMQ